MMDTITITITEDLKKILRNLELLAMFGYDESTLYSDETEGEMKEAILWLEDLRKLVETYAWTD